MHFLAIVLIAIVGNLMLAFADPIPMVSDRQIVMQICCMADCLSCNWGSCVEQGCENNWPYSNCCATIISGKRDEFGAPEAHNERGERMHINE